MAEDPTGGKATPGDVDADNCEVFWCSYAWPLEREGTGTSAYFANQSGEIMMCRNDVAKYEGHGTVPAGDAAFLQAGTITGTMAINQVGQDGETWKRVQ